VRLLLEIQVFVSVRKGASLLQSDVPGDLLRFSQAESLKLPRTGPPGWKIYTARGSKFLLYRRNFGRYYFDLRFQSGYSFPLDSRLECGFRTRQTRDSSLGR
jgi:hypothetical protein